MGFAHPVDDLHGVLASCHASRLRVYLDLSHDPSHSFQTALVPKFLAAPSDASSTVTRISGPNQKHDHHDNRSYAVAGVRGSRTGVGRWRHFEIQEFC